MFSAYFYYLLPLGVALIFFVSALTVLVRYAKGGRDARGRKYGPSDGGGAVLLMLFSGGISLAILLSPTPWQRTALFAHLFHTAPDQIVKVTLSRNTGIQPLVTRPVVITDRREIEEIARALADADDCSPSHPTPDWNAEVTLTTTQGEFSFPVAATSNGNGTLASVFSSGDTGCHLGDFRVDRLRPILERAAAAARASGDASAPAK
jgi:hypothetical protein